MISRDILNHFGCTTQNLRRLFTEDDKQPTAPLDLDPEKAQQAAAEAQRRRAIRDSVKELIRSRVSDGITQTIKNYRRMMVADLAWDGPAITGMKIPLMLYAQGAIDVERCVAALERLPDGKLFLSKDAKGRPHINLPMFVDISVHLVRSMVTRRHAAQAGKYANLWPYYRYEARDTSQVGKLRADLMSQRADVMCDQFGHRHSDVQAMRAALLYGFSVDFIRRGWEVERAIDRVPVSDELKTTEVVTESRVVREGLAWVTPHTSRVFHDNAYPLATINSDSGVEWLGYWDVARYRDIAQQPRYWNRDKVSQMSNMPALLAAHPDYFNQYFGTVISPTADPAIDQFASKSVDLAAANDRSNNVGYYTDQQGDAGVFKTEFFWRVIPKDYGLGDYPHPVWTRWVVASDSTILFAEFLTSRPAAYLGHNQHDARQSSISFAHEIMGWQDQVTNLVTMMLKLAALEVLKIILINTDVVGKEQVEKLLAKFEGHDWAGDPLMVSWAFGDLKEMDIDIRAIRVEGTGVSGSISSIISAIAQCIAICEKLAAMSPAELGQPAPREITASEVNEMAGTTASVYTFFSDQIDEFLAAKKAIIYESTITRQQAPFELPAMRRYTGQTIKAAGFTAQPIAGETLAQPGDPGTYMITGTAAKLQHDYIFTTRDGAERAVNSQSANTLVQLLSSITSFPPALQALGKTKLYGILNEIFRLSGAAMDLNLELEEGESDDLGMQDIQQLQAMVQQLADQVRQIAETVQGHDDVIRQIPALAQQLKQALAPAGATTPTTPTQPQPQPTVP